MIASGFVIFRRVPPVPAASSSLCLGRGQRPVRFQRARGLVVAVLGLATFAAQRRARAAASSLAVPGFVLAVSVPVSLSAGIASAVALVVVVTVAVGARISIQAFEEFPLAAGRAETSPRLPVRPFPHVRRRVLLAWRGKSHRRQRPGRVRWCAGAAAVIAGRAACSTMQRGL